jgi:hypothetical protein
MDGVAELPKLDNRLTLPRDEHAPHAVTLAHLKFANHDAPT